MKAVTLKTESLLRRAGILRLSSKTISDGIRSGNFKSVYRGRGIEFSGVREYLRGDDVRSIDWNVTARMGRAFVKQFEEDRELILFLIVDSSLSMHSGSTGKSRLYTACEVAALSAFAAEQTASPVGGVIFDQDISFCCEPKSGRDQVLMLLSKYDSVLEAMNSKGKTKKGSDLERALKCASMILKKRALVLVISDFRTTGYEKSLALLGSKHDVVAVCVTDPSDLELPDVGSIPFIDMESGFTQRLPTNSVAFRRSWRDSCRQRIERWQNICYRRGVIPLEISTEDDSALRLNQFFSLREGQ